MKSTDENHFSDIKSMTSEILSDKTDNSYYSSRTSSLVTFPSRAHGETLRHSETSCESSDDGACKNIPLKVRAVVCVEKKKNDAVVLSSSWRCRLNRKIKRNLTGAEFPLSDVSNDKSTASQAVAFVIRASRRGVVPLCAEVADLLKEKARLELENKEQKEEILQLMQNQMMPHSPAPPPPLMVDFSMQTLQDMDCQTVSLESVQVQTENLVLPCAQTKYLDENEEVAVETTEIPGVEFQCGRNYSVQCLCPTMTTSSTQNSISVNVGTNTEKVKKLHSELGYYEHHQLEQRHRNLEGKHKELKNETKDKTVKNYKLESDLKKAKQEIISLQQSIQNMQTKEYERVQEEERLNLADSFSVDVNNGEDSCSEDSDNNRLHAKRRLNVVITDGKRNIVSIDSGDKLRSLRSSIFPGPILGCKCEMCSAFFRSSGLLGFACTPYVTDSSGRNPVLKDLRKLVSLQNSKLQVHPNDTVLLKNSRTGVVRYVGHLDGAGTPSIVYIGIELSSPEGKHDGYLFGRRYFFSPQNHAIFLPLQDVLCVLDKKLKSPITRQRYPSITSRRSTKSDDKANGQKASPKLKSRSKKQSSAISSISETSSDDSRLPAVTTR